MLLVHMAHETTIGAPEGIRILIPEFRKLWPAPSAGVYYSINDNLYPFSCSSIFTTLK